MPHYLLPRLLCLALLVAPTASAQDAEITDFAHTLLSEAQALSIARNREYCGTIGEDANGDLVATDPRRGRRMSCKSRTLWAAEYLLASFHTHGAHDPRIDSEVPSPSDVENDMDEGIDGYVATPGGRLWFINGATGVSTLICGPGCLPSDPAYRPDPSDPIARRYTLPALRARNE